MEAGRIVLHYRLESKIGVGGMGEVWRASDTTLARDVAIKVLPPVFAADPERLARFEREAKVLASLNHPNIAAIYGLHQDDGVRFLAMELAAGEDLSERLSRGAVPVDDAVDIARQIAEALEAAHEQGIVHRDLKPANVKIGPDGKVKVLDFGLAKAMDPASTMSGSRQDAGMSPTVTSLGTVAGVILGTAAYMSPEQARGKAADRRADIWAFGVILFEMLSGRRMFDGETISDTLAAILKSQPEWSALPEATPPALRRLLERCLEHDPRQRLRDIGEARIVLSRGLKPETAVATPSTAAPRNLLPWILFAAAALVAVVLAVRDMTSEPVREARVRKFEIDANLPPRGNSRAFQISPDGTRILFQSERGIEVRELSESESRLLLTNSDVGGSSAQATPFWSPDGAQFAYVARGALMRMSIAGGASTTVCKLPGEWMAGAWMGDGTIAFATTRGPMYRVSSTGGDPALFIPLAPDEELDFHQPHVLPDGRSLIYPVHRTAGVDTIEMFRDGKRSVILRVDTTGFNVQDSPQFVNTPFYAPSGHLLYQRDQGNQGLWALPFSAERGVATGEPFLVAPDVGYASVASDGTLIYADLTNVSSGQLTLVTRDGSVERTLGETQLQLDVGPFSADGRRLLYTAAATQGADIHVWDLEADRAVRLTDTPESEADPVWLAGGSRIGYSAPDQGCRSVFAMNADGTGSRERLAVKATSASFTPDGGGFVYVTMCQDRRGLDSGTLGQPEVKPLIADAAGIDAPQLSPDGRYLLYRTWAGGQSQYFVTRYPSLDGRWPVKRSEYPARWSAGGKEIVYMEGPPFRLLAVPTTLDPVFSLGTPRELFSLERLGAAGALSVSPDGKRIALVVAAGDAHRRKNITVVENWFEPFRKR